MGSFPQAMAAEMAATPAHRARNRQPRTLDVRGMPAFKTGAFGRSATPPLGVRLARSGWGRNVFGVGCGNRCPF